MADTDFLQLLPPTARYRREPIDDGDNALSYWDQAARVMVRPEDDELYERLVAADPRTGIPFAFPSGSDAGRLRQLLKDNRSTRQLLHTGVGCGRIQFPQPDAESGDFAEHAESLTPLVELARGWYLHARSLIAAGELAAAGSELTALGQMGWIICAGEGLVVHYLIGNAIMAMSFNGIRELAGKQAFPGTVIADITIAFNRWITQADDMSQCLRVELCSSALPEVARLSECSGLEALVDELLDRHYANAELPAPESARLAPRDGPAARKSSSTHSLTGSECGDGPGEDNGRLAWRRKQILDLLDAHPDPFDKIATVRCMGQLTADRIVDLKRSQRSNLAGHWSRLRRSLRHHRFRIRMRSWPNQLRAEFPLEYLGPSEAAHQRRAELKPLVSPGQWAQLQPPSENRLRAARRRLHSTPNALGLLIADALLGTDIRHHESLRRRRLSELRAEIEDAPSTASRPTGREQNRPNRIAD